MADTAIAITAGTGTNVDTRTESTNGNHRQVVVIGDPATNAGVAPVDATNGLAVDVKASALPTGAATAAKQPALGTAGTASTDVLTVQGIASMTPLKTDGSATTQPVSGTVTANLSATDKAVLDAIQTGTDKIPAQGQALAAASLPVVLPAAQIATLTPPAAITGFATETKQDTIIGHMDGVEGLLTTIDADTSALAGAVAGTELQVDVVSLPAVDTELPAAAALADATASPTAPAVGGFNMVRNRNAGSWSMQTAISPASKNFNGEGAAAAGAVAQFDDNTPGSVTEDNFGNLRMSVRRELYTQIRDAAGNERGLNVDANGEIGISALRGALPAGTNTIGKLAANSGVDIGDVDVTSLPALPAGTNLIGYVGHGKTIKTVTGTVTADTDIVAAVASKRIKVIAYSLITGATTANTITFQSNATTALWTVPLQAITGTVAGANLAIPAPSFLFATAAGEKLTLDVSAAQSITYSVTYFDDDAS
jgi:hypothetical protein